MNIYSSRSFYPQENWYKQVYVVTYWPTDKYKCTECIMTNFHSAILSQSHVFQCNADAMPTRRLATYHGTGKGKRVLVERQKRNLREGGPLSLGRNEAEAAGTAVISCCMEAHTVQYMPMPRAGQCAGGLDWRIAVAIGCLK
jgi:hypothetical protein